MSYRKGRLDVLKGILLLFGGHILVIAVLWTLAYLLSLLFNRFILHPVATFFLFGIGLAQFLYAVPLYFRLMRRGHVEMAKGVVIGAVITFLLNGSCFALGLYFLSTMHG